MLTLSLRGALGPTSLFAVCGAWEWMSAEFSEHPCNNFVSADGSKFPRIQPSFAYSLDHYPWARQMRVVPRMDRNSITPTLNSVSIIANARYSFDWMLRHDWRRLRVKESTRRRADFPVLDAFKLSKPSRQRRTLHSLAHF
jgi:hypothetical protein